MLYYENFDLDNVVTPVRARELQCLLEESGYDENKTKKLVKNFKTGFSLGYVGPQNIQITAPNLKFRGVGNKIILWNKVLKEVKLLRFAGPFAEIPYDNYIQSPIGLVPKDNGKDCHLIFHLSYPRGKGTSVNANTDPQLCSA